MMAAASSVAASSSSATIDILALWDRSGSMRVMGNEPVDAFNAFIANLVKEQPSDDVDTIGRVTLVTFNHTQNCVFLNEPLRDAHLLGRDYTCENTTSLYDCVCEAFTQKLEGPNPDNVVAVIMTDGEDTSSKEFTREDISRMVAMVEEQHNWKVVFLGANLDVGRVAESMSISLNRQCTYDQSIPGNLVAVCEKTSNSVSSYARQCSSNVPNRELSFNAATATDLSSIPLSATLCPPDLKRC